MFLKSRLITFVSFTFILTLLFTRSVLAADFVVTGTALDGKNNPIVNTKVTVSNVITQQIITTTTSDKNGYYTFSVPKGTYNITTTPPLGSGLQPTTYSHILISSDLKLQNSVNAVGNAPAAGTTTVQKPQPLSFTRVIVIFVVFLVLVICYIVWKKKMPTPSN